MIGWKDAIEVGKWAWDNRAGVKPVLTSFRRWLRRSKLLVIGPGGTGKSTLARMLSGEFDWLLDSPWRYDENVGVTRSALKADPAAEIVVMPGQQHRRRTSWAGVGQDIANGTFQGVLLLSAFGHHSLSDSSYKLHRLFEPERDKDTFWRKYLEANRADEIACLKQLVPFIKACQRKLWLASVVTKQDLWRASDAAVERWYREGEYGQLIEEIAVHKGDTFRHEFHPMSLVIGNLATKNEKLAKNVEGYDQQQQVESVRRLFEVVEGLRKWGAEK
ncbi:hypothetical protein R5W24_005209 [Gemmata sp. JC717]|uniref:hypothetical protein n=1 Tax=Gemmata algarum TaxID=2975278 RepID=UPI0021BB2618|nr:hypothetical protein [Gemmata algarum]MDY3556046.1 hypothetical protein [Gemmata algarum]